MPGTDEEFAEFETDEATFDAMLDRAEPAELVAPPARVSVTVSRGVQITMGDSASTRAGRSRLESRARRRPAIRHDERIEQVAS